jgi:hypothetical protein
VWTLEMVSFFFEFQMDAQIANLFLIECHWPAMISSPFAIIFVSSFISCSLLHLYLYPDPLARRQHVFVTPSFSHNLQIRQ